MNHPILLRIAAAFGFAAVAFGAFGAHALHPRLVAHGTVAIWQTAASYHLAHTIVLLILGLQAPPRRLPFYLFAIGILIFSGSLYALAFTNVKILGAITPFGGLSLLAGWLSLLFSRKEL
jgi:uncharacterized membrane protein YgdD (TMEM256/DUF423 family)